MTVEFASLKCKEIRTIKWFPFEIQKIKSARKIAVISFDPNGAIFSVIRFIIDFFINI